MTTETTPQTPPQAAPRATAPAPAANVAPAASKAAKPPVAPAASQAKKAPAAPQAKAVAPAPAKAASAVGMVLTNCTDTPRGITLKGGIVILQPREMRQVPLQEQGELRAMFHTRTFQRFVDNGIFRLSGISDDEDVTAVPTPDAPDTLTDAVKVEGLGNPVDVTAPPKVVEHQHGGALPGTGPDAAPVAL